MPERDSDALYMACEHYVSYHYHQSPREVFAALAEYTPADLLEGDHYGEGKLINDFEAEIAGLLGKPAAVFMPSGTMAQQIALRIWADRSGNRSVAFHPTCHLEVHEEQGYRLLHGLHGELVGSRYRLMTLDDLKEVGIPLGALLLELPQRTLGGVLPAWDDLAAMIEWAHGRGMVTHLDGARLWECKPFYGRKYAEIGALFDTVYVSFYKILGGITGALLAGPEDVIKEVRVWQRRHGGNLVHMYPFVLSAKMGLEKRLTRIDDYCAQARAIAAALDAVPEIEVTPNPPHTNMMLVFLRGKPERLREAALDIAEEKKVWVAGRFSPSQIPAYSSTELVAGEAALDMEAAGIGALFAELVERARAKEKA